MISNLSKRIVYYAIILFLCISFKGMGQDLKQNFINPPSTVKPKTWMHVMGGNMSKVGMTKDLEAMAENGIGGIILFNVTVGTPKKGNTKFNSPDHIEKTAHAAAECQRLGLSFGIHNCDGWTASGGPWVTPEHSMKQIVYSQTIVEGGNTNVNLKTPSQRGDYYKDIAVIAYPTMQAEMDDDSNKPLLSSSDKNLDLQLIVDGKIDNRSQLHAVDKVAWVQFEYKKPFTLRSLQLNCYKKISDKGKIWLQTSNDGVNYKDVQELKILRVGKDENATDNNFEGVTSNFFRVKSEIPLDLSEINLSSVFRFDNMLGRTSLYMLETHKMPKISEANKNMIINKNDIINLTAKMTPDGKLTAKLPKGKWTIMRFGYTIMGATNGPSSVEGKGWEVDKMSRESFKIFYEGYVRNVIEASKKVAPDALQYIEIDSYEVGGQNWTQGYDKLYKDKFNYDIMDYLPLYAGRYINNTETTDRILWDMRNFNSKLITDNYFDYFSELCHEDGLISYVEPYSFNAAFNELDATRKVDITMGEFWMHDYAETETAVSGARIYGKNIVSAEAFTALPEVNWAGHPGSLKLSGDRAWTSGINEFFFHRFTHQPNTNVVPGLTMHVWGSHMDRTQTWWKGAGKSWFKYLARGQFMLRQGIPVSDVLAFVGDGSPNSILDRNEVGKNLPNSINYDCINADALLTRISAKDGKLSLPNGIQYRALYLSPIPEINLTTLRKIAEIAENGVPIVGLKPKSLGGFMVSEADRKEFDVLVAKIWGIPTTQEKANWEEVFVKNKIPFDLKITNGEKVKYTHRKTVNEDIYFFYNPEANQKTFDCTFNVNGKVPEFWNQMTGEISKLASFESIDGQTRVAITLPSEGSGFIVFRDNSKDITTVSPTYAINHPNLKFTLDEKNQLQVQSDKNEIIDVALSQGKNTTLNVNEIPANLVLNAPWQVSFPSTKSGGKTLEFKTLTDWTLHSDEEIKHYSGTASYKTTFTIGKNELAKNLICTLDLGQVNIAARVIVNGKDMGVLWMKPHTINITSMLKKGANTLEIEVTNQWTNRLIGDEQFPDETGYYSSNSKEMPDWFINNEPAPLKKRSTFTTYNFFTKDSKLIPAGLIGPVQLQFSKIMSETNSK